MGGRIEKRRWPRRQVDLSVVVSRPESEPITRVVDLSEGGARLDWTLPADVQLGDSVRLRFLLGGGQGLDIEARVARVGEGHTGLEFLPSQRELVRQLMAEFQSDD